MADMVCLGGIQRCPRSAALEGGGCSRIEPGKTFPHAEADVTDAPYRPGKDHIRRQFVQRTDNGKIIQRPAHVSDQSLAAVETVECHAIFDGPSAVQMSFVPEVRDEVAPAHAFVGIAAITVTVGVLTAEYAERKTVVSVN